MTINRIVRAVAGGIIVLSLVLSHVAGGVDLSKLSWLWLTLFVGGNLLQSAFTRFCPLDIVLKKLGAPESETH